MSTRQEAAAGSDSSVLAISSLPKCVQSNERIYMLSLQLLQSCVHSTSHLLDRVWNVCVCVEGVEGGRETHLSLFSKLSISFECLPRGGSESLALKPLPRFYCHCYDLHAAA